MIRSIPILKGTIRLHHPYDLIILLNQGTKLPLLQWKYYVEFINILVQISLKHYHLGNATKIPCGIGQRAISESPVSYRLLCKIHTPGTIARGMAEKGSNNGDTPPPSSSLWLPDFCEASGLKRAEICFWKQGKVLLENVRRGVLRKR